ncbi:hypothetical protein MTO96_026303 [Rhipicephalus appendiculatus]
MRDRIYDASANSEGVQKHRIPSVSGCSEETHFTDSKLVDSCGNKKDEYVVWKEFGCSPTGGVVRCDYRAQRRL